MWTVMYMYARDIDIVDIALLRRFFDSILETLLQYGICVIPIFTDNW